MIPNRLLLLFLSLFCTLSSIYAQQETHAHQEKSRKCMLCLSGTNHSSHERPYRDFSFKSELPLLSGIFGLSTLSLVLKSPTPLTVEQVNLLDKNEVNAFDRYAISKNSASAQNISDVFLTGVLVLPAIFLSNHHTRKDILPLALMSVETIIINIALTDITKKLASRTRPLAYNPNFSIEEKTKENARVSFFSGHTSHTASLSFLMAKVMTDYHPHAKKGFKIGIWAFAAAVPGVTGYLRVRAGKHFPTDTIAGFIAGGLVGVLVPHFHRKKQIIPNGKVSVTPSIGIGTAALTMRF